MFRCAGCSAVLEAVPRPFRCPAARDGDDIDHVLVPLPSRASHWPDPPATGQVPNPFTHYRSLLSAWRLALSCGTGDHAYRDLAAGLDAAIARVDGSGFRFTPFVSHPRLAAPLGFEPGGELWVKDETRNVSGSHKARHLAGVMLYLLVAERAGMDVGREAGGLLNGSGVPRRPPLAIASCGNAALAAAVVARAAGWPLQVFVPPTANRAVLARLDALDARITTCPRQPGIAGDPCYLAFKHALREGALPFCCQGSDNGLTIEGGETLAWEMVDQLAAASSLPAAPPEERPIPGRAKGRPLDAIFVQVGGGALASAIIQGFDVARRLGATRAMPKVYAVQTAGGHPLARAYGRLIHCIEASGDTASAAEPPARRLPPPCVGEAMSYARTHRSEFMWPWEEEPSSIAHGILDDETYDWAAVVEGMLKTGGRPLVVGERRLEEANEIGRSLTGIDVDHTGSAGLAGLIDALSEEPALRRARVAVVFSGGRRLPA